MLLGAHLGEGKVQKTSKRSTEPSGDYRPRVKRGVTPPDVINVDDIAVMKDEDLIVRLRTLEDDKNKAVDGCIDTRPWEEEIAYIRREQQIRRARRDAHLEFERYSEVEFNRTEAGLPPGDFDNLAFVYAATGGKPRWN